MGTEADVSKKSYCPLAGQSDLISQDSLSVKYHTFQLSHAYFVRLAYEKCVAYFTISTAFLWDIL